MQYAYCTALCMKECFGFPQNPFRFYWTCGCLVRDIFKQIGPNIGVFHVSATSWFDLMASIVFTEEF